MPSNVTYNDFRGGMVSEKMRRRVDLQNYSMSASLIRNAVPLRTGGLTLRPGLKLYDLDASISSKSRVFTYTIDADESYSVIVVPNRIYIYGPDGNGGIKNVYQDGHYAPYLEDELSEIVCTQNYECMVLCQRNHPPYVIQRSSKKVSSDNLLGFSVEEIVLKTTTDASEEEGESYFWDYDGLFTKKDYPATCAFMAERLWFMGSNDHPYRMWASRPFDYFNFQDMDYYKYLDESQTSEQYVKALSEYGSRSEMIASDSTIYFKDSKTVSAEGYVTITQGIAETGTGVYIDTTDPRLTAELLKKYDLYDDSGNAVNPKTEAFYYTKPVEKWDTVVRADCSLELDMSSDRNERISWMAYAGSYMYIGTFSSEWAIPSSVDATNVSNSKVSSFGSSLYRQCAYGANTIFYIQSGAKRIRAIAESSDGTMFTEPTYQAEDIFSEHGGIKEISWQRVPSPRLYATLKDGDMAVLSYDAYYGMNAWCVWHSEYKILSTSIRDTEDGQEAVCLIEAQDGSVMIGIFEEGRLYDGELPFTAELVTNNIDSTSTLSYKKYPYNVFVDSMQTEFTASQKGIPIQASRNYEKDMVKLSLNGRPTDEGLRISIRSKEGKPFTLLALIVEVEVT